MWAPLVVPPHREVRGISPAPAANRNSPSRLPDAIGLIGAKHPPRIRRAPHFSESPDSPPQINRCGQQQIRMVKSASTASPAQNRSPRASSFGSQIASVQTGCGTGWQILTTSAADYSKPDSIQAQEWTGREFRAVSAAMEFDGPVLALRRGTETNSVRAIVHNLKTGMYEAYSLNVFCNR